MPPLKTSAADPVPTPPRRVGLMAAAAALLSGCSGSAVLNALVPRDGHRLREAQAYGALARQQLDVYLPLGSNAVPGVKAPLAVFFYGGSWSRGDRADYRFVGQALASRGVVTVVADYRLSPQARYPQFLQDCALAVRWAFDHAVELGADPAQIYLMGHSAGAYNAAMLALDSRWLAEVGLTPQRLSGWVGLAGPYDFLPIVNPEAQVAFDWPRTPADTQPIAHVGPGAPRALLIAARHDNMVNPQRSTVGLGQRLQRAGVDARVSLLERVNHVTVLAAMAYPLTWMAPVLEEVLAFMGHPNRANPG